MPTIGAIISPIKAMNWFTFSENGPVKNSTTSIIGTRTIPATTRQDSRVLTAGSPGPGTPTRTDCTR
jgi:hypothetical protein